MLGDQAARERPQVRRPSLDGRPIPLQHLLVTDGVLRPRAPARPYVHEQRLQAIQRLGELRIERLGCLELLSEGAQLVRLRRREQSENAFGRRALELGLILTLCPVDRHVARVDLDDIVDQQHLDDSEHVDVTHRVVGQQDRVQREVPRVLRGVFSLRSGGGRVDATREWLVGAKGEYPIHRPYLPCVGNDDMTSTRLALAASFDRLLDRVGP